MNAALRFNAFGQAWCDVCTSWKSNVHVCEGIAECRTCRETRESRQQSFEVWSKGNDSPEWFREPDCTFDERVDAELAIEDLRDIGGIWTTLEYEIRMSKGVRP